MNPVETHIYNQEEPYRSIMIYIRELITRTIPEIEETYNYKIPFFACNRKPILYLNVLKGTSYVDVAFVQGILLENEFPQLKNGLNRKQVRSIPVYNLTDFDEMAFVQLLLKAQAKLKKSKKAWFIDTR